MSYKIIAIPRFKREIKRLTKKFPSLKKEYSELIEALEKEPKFGTSLCFHCYKIRMAIASKGKGKSGGARVITYLFIADTIVFLLSIYDKSERNDISDKELLKLLKELP